MDKGKSERLTLPKVEELQRMLRLANALHALPPEQRISAALSGLTELAEADLAAAWSGPAERLISVGVFASSSPPPPPDDLVPTGVRLLIGRRPRLSPVVRLHSDPATRMHEIRSVCAGPAGPSLLVLRRAQRPFEHRQRTIIHLLHPQLEWALRPPVGPTTQPALSAKHRLVLQLLLSGETEKQMAERLSKNEHTIHSRIKSIYRHFGVASRAQLLSMFVVQPPKPEQVR